MLFDFELSKLEKTKEIITNLINFPELKTESVFQDYISKIICLIFPKYLYAFREIPLKGIDRDKRPDFMMVDHQGFVDVLEIKKPNFNLLSSHLYRNNYVPSTDLSGTCQQVEKYILCLNHYADDFESQPPKVITSILKSNNSELKLKINNPKGIIIAGRDKFFSENKQQLYDFELIRRQHKNIIDIITYDDLIRRLENSINFLKQRRSDSYH